MLGRGHCRPQPTICNPKRGAPGRSRACQVDDLLGTAVAEVFLFFVVTHVGKGENSDGTSGGRDAVVGECATDQIEPPASSWEY